MHELHCLHYIEPFFGIRAIERAVLPHMRIILLAHTRMGYPVRVWDNIMSHTRMGVPYEYACMIIRSYTTCTPGIY